MFDVMYFSNEDMFTLRANIELKLKHLCLILNNSLAEWIWIDKVMLTFQITTYLGKRDFIDHINHIDPIGKSWK